MTDGDWEKRDYHDLVKVLFVGGHPKGYRDAFSRRTLSGKRLRAFCQSLKLKSVEYIDVWRNEDEEKRMVTNEDILRRIIRREREGWTIVALGRRVEDHLKNNRLAFDCKLPFWKFWYLPHPASRDPTSLELLRAGLFAVSRGFQREALH